MTDERRVLVVGATGGSGRAAVEALLEAGHRVTAFSRHAGRLPGASGRLTRVNGDATRPEDLDRAVRGHDAVVVTLGITENPLRVRLLGSAGTPLDVRSVGTRNAIAAMHRHGVRRLVVQSSYGVGATRGRLRTADRVLFHLLLKPQIDDTGAQEREVRQSGLDWVLAQPVHLTDEAIGGRPHASAEGEVQAWRVSRAEVGRFLAEAVVEDADLGRSVALSRRAGAE